MLDLSHVATLRLPMPVYLVIDWAVRRGAVVHHARQLQPLNIKSVSLGRVLSRKAYVRLAQHGFIHFLDPGTSKTYWHWRSWWAWTPGTCPCGRGRGVNFESTCAECLADKAGLP